MGLKGKITISGISSICSLGADNDSIWDSLLNKKINLVEIQEKIDKEEVVTYKKYIVAPFNPNGILKNKKILTEIRYWKNEKNIAEMEMLLVAIERALNDAKTEINSKTGLILIHENPGLENLMSHIIDKSYSILHESKNCSKNEYFHRVYKNCEKSAYETQSFMLLHHVAKYFNIHAYSLIINNACSSGLYAIELAAQLIKNKDLEQIIIAAVDKPGVFKNLWLKSMGLYSKTEKIRTYCKSRDGFLSGEAASAIVIQKHSTEEKYNKNYYCDYLGGCFALESWKVTYPSISDNYLYSVITNLLNKLKLPKERIDFVCTHGVSNKVGDKYESIALNKTFKKKMPPVTSFKAYTGHTLGNSSLLETILTILCIKNAKAIPLCYTKDLDQSLSLNFMKDIIKLNKKSMALKLSTSFGGYTGAILLKRDKM